MRVNRSVRFGADPVQNNDPPALPHQWSIAPDETLRRADCYLECTAISEKNQTAVKEAAAAGAAAAAAFCQQIQTSFF
jgi:hypothetical protein